MLVLATATATTAAACNALTGAQERFLDGTVLAPTNGEFGILTRVQPGGSGAFLFGSKFGAENRQFLGSIVPPDWNPTLDTRAPTEYV